MEAGEKSLADDLRERRKLDQCEYYTPEDFKYIVETLLNYFSKFEER